MKVKEPPNSKESEMIVLGCMLTSIDFLSIGATSLVEDDFYYTQHQIIFSSLKTAYQAGKSADIHLVAEELMRRGKINEVGGIAYLTSLAQFAGTSAYIEEYIDVLRGKSILRKMISIGQNMAQSALENPTDTYAVFDKFREEFNGILSTHVRKIPIPLMENCLEVLEEKLKTRRGKKYLGLCQKTIPEIDDKFLGLRKLIVLAAAPNVGKTALTNQFVIDVLKNHPEACVVYFSLEMGTDDLLIRMVCNQAQMDYRTFVLGSDAKNGGLIREAFFNASEMESIMEAEAFLKSLKNRLQIVDKELYPFLTASHAIAHIEAVKQRSQCERVFVVIDYLQVWPLNPQVKFFNENEIDKWRMGEAMKISKAIGEDPIIVISEARKPQGDNKWGGDMSDVMGAARMTYSPDAVLLFSQLGFQEFSNLWTNGGKLTRHQRKNAIESQKAPEEDIQRLSEYLEHEGISICRLDMPKGRDGMQKFSILLEFLYRKNIFKEANFARIKAESMKYTGKSK